MTNGILDSSQKIVTNGLVLNYDIAQLRCYPKTGTAVQNLASTSNNGTLVNGVSFDSENGGSLVFDGVNDSVTTTAGSSFAYGTGNFTVDGWFFCTKTLPAYGERIFSQTVSGTNYFVVQIGTDSITPEQKVTFTFALSGGGTTINSSNTWSYNTWNYFAVSRINNSVTVYLNAIGGTPVSCTQNFTNTTYIPTIGQYSHTFQYGFGGRISNLSVYKGKGLTSTEVSQNFNANKSRYGL